MKTKFIEFNEKINDLLNDEIPNNDNEAALYIHMKKDTEALSYVKYSTPENIGLMLFQVACSDIVFASELTKAAEMFNNYFNKTTETIN